MSDAGGLSSVTAGAPAPAKEGAMLTLTDNAIRKVKALLAEDAALAGKALRMFVQQGGCAGWEYGFGFDDKKENDQVLPVDGFEVVVDPQSAPLLAGSIVDYVETLEGEGFSVTNPNARHGCGCGHSFDV
jgi:iron-sulfur cluster assembly protein